MKTYFSTLRLVLQKCTLVRQGGWYRIKTPWRNMHIEVYNAVALVLEYGLDVFDGPELSGARRVASYNRLEALFPNGLYHDTVRAAYRPEVIRTATDRSNHIRRVYSRLYAMQNAHKNLTTSESVL